MKRDSKRRLTRTFIILGVTLGSSLAVYLGLVVSVGVSQPLMLVASNSMEPTISVGDIIVIKSADTSQVHLGDVIVYEKSLGKFSILHRVVCIVTSSGSSCTPPFYAYVDCYLPPCYYTKGDSNPAPDPWVVLSSEIRGVWTGFRIPYIGMSLICLQQGPTCQTPWEVISIVALGSAIVSDIGFEYWLSRKPTKNQQIISEQSSRAGGRSWDLDLSKITRALLGPILLLVVLVGVGYGAVGWEHSHPIYLTTKAVSMRFVSNQGTPNISNWNMTLENNGTITAILGQICQRDLKTNNCNAIGPQFWGAPTTSDFYLTPGERTVFKLVAVNATYSTWELHLQLFPWASNRPPSDQEVINTVNNQPAEAEWLFYNSTSNSFVQ